MFVQATCLHCDRVSPCAWPSSPLLPPPPSSSLAPSPTSSSPPGHPSSAPWSLSSSRSHLWLHLDPPTGQQGHRAEAKCWRRRRRRGGAGLGWSSGSHHLDHSSPTKTSTGWFLLAGAKNTWFKLNPFQQPLLASVVAASSCLALHPPAMATTLGPSWPLVAVTNWFTVAAVLQAVIVQPPHEPATFR